MEKISGVFGIILLTFLENLVIFCWGGGWREECKKIFMFAKKLRTKKNLG